MNELVVVFVRFDAKKVSAQQRVKAWKNLNLAKLFIFSDAQAMTVVMVEVISTMVLSVPSQTFSQPCGQKPSGAPTRRRM